MDWRKNTGTIYAAIGGFMLLLGSFWNFAQGRADIGACCLLGAVLFGLLTAALFALTNQ